MRLPILIKKVVSIRRQSICTYILGEEVILLSFWTLFSLHLKGLGVCKAK